MAQQGNPYLIPLGNSGMVAHPNRWRAKAGELLFAENVVVENDLVNKEPAAKYYQQNGTDHLTLRMTWSAATTSIAMALWYDALPTAYVGADVITMGAAAPTNPWTGTFTGTVPVGQVVAIRVSGRTNSPSAITDTRGNVYARVGTFDYTGTSPALHGEIWLAVVTTAIQSGDTLTVTLTASAAVNLIATAIVDLVLPLKLRSSSADGSTAATSWDLWGRTQFYPLVGIGLVASIDTSVTPSFPNSKPFTHNSTLTTGGHTLVAMASDVYWSATKIAAQIEYSSDDTSTFTGTQPVSVVAGSRLVTTGIGTNFSVGLYPGDTIIVGGESQVVSSIQSPTQLTTIGPWQATRSVAATTVIRRAAPRLVTAINLGDPQFNGYIFRDVPDPDSNGETGTLGGQTLASNLAQVRPGRFVVGGRRTPRIPGSSSI